MAGTKRAETSGCCRLERRPTDKRQMSVARYRRQVKLAAFTTYGNMYGMDKTTVYLPRDLKDGLAAAAKRRQVSEAELIREGIALAISSDEPRSPRLPLYRSGDPDLAANFDERLKGFGET